MLNFETPVGGQFFDSSLIPQKHDSKSHFLKQLFLLIQQEKNIYRTRTHTVNFKHLKHNPSYESVLRFYIKAHHYWYKILNGILRGRWRKHTKNDPCSMDIRKIKPD